MISFINSWVSTLPTTRGTTGGSRSRSTHTTRGNNRSGTFETRGRTLAQIAHQEGYTLLEHDEWSTRSIIAKARKSGHVVALKLLSHKRRNELDILVDLQKFNSSKNHTIELLHVHHHGHSDVIVMPWRLLLDDFLDKFPTTVASMLDQLLEGVSFLHGCGYAHLDLKPGNILVGCKDGPSPHPRLSLIDYGISLRVRSEETKVRGYRGTPFWSAPEVGTEDGPAMTYSPIRADRWSCGRILEHMRKFHPVEDTLVDTKVDTSIFLQLQNELLCSNPKLRPPLCKILDRLRTRYPSKRSSDTDEVFVVLKRHKSSSCQPYVYFSLSLA